jgi:AraC-like DNA-binding protein
MRVLGGKGIQKNRNRTMMSPDSDSIDHRVKIALLFIEANRDRQLSLNEIAQSINISPWHLCRLFKIGTGTSVTQYVLGLRMQEAKELLETTCLRIKEIMNQVGIRDESHFARTFKKLFGMSPTQYRALHRAQPLAIQATADPSHNSLKAAATA